MPIGAISAWYNYSRTGGVRHNTNYPSYLSNLVAGSSRSTLCAPIYDWLDTVDGDETGDYNDFWEDRNHNKDVANVKAAVFGVHGFQDDNVMLDQLTMWWRASPPTTCLASYCNGCARPRGMQLRRLLDLRGLLDRATRITIEGHTAGPGPEIENRTFGERRARLAARILRQGRSARLPLRVRSFGDNRPIASNRDEVGQAKNRRVVVRIVLLRD